MAELLQSSAAPPLPIELLAQLRAAFGGSSYRAMMIEPGSNRRRSAGLAKRARTVVADLNHDAWMAEIEERVAIVVQEDVDEDVAARCARRLSATGSLRSTGKIAIGRRANGIEGIRQSLRDARWALRVSRRSRRKVVWFEDLGADMWLAAIGADLGEGTMPAIDRLIEYDDCNRSDLLMTLCTFLHEGHMQGSARTLGIHRNTVRYRLGQVRQVTGLDPCDPEGRLVLQLQVRAAEIGGLLASRGSRKPVARPIR